MKIDGISFFFTTSCQGEIGEDGATKGTSEVVSDLTKNSVVNLILPTYAYIMRGLVFHLCMNKSIKTLTAK